MFTVVGEGLRKPFSEVRRRRPPNGLLNPRRIEIHASDIDSLAFRWERNQIIPVIGESRSLQKVLHKLQVANRTQAANVEYLTDGFIMPACQQQRLHHIVYIDVVT